MKKQDINENCKGFLKAEMDNEVRIFCEELKDHKDCIVLRVRNAMRSREYLEDKPHRIVMDLALYYAFQIPMEEYEASIIVTNQIADGLVLSEEELFELAQENSPRIHPDSICEMRDILSECMGVCPDEMLGKDQMPGVPMRVLSNDKRHYGASCLFYRGVVDEIYIRYGKSIILPSSTHEVLIIPADTGDYGALAELVHEVNSTLVDEKDYLSDEIYLIDQEGIRIIRSERDDHFSEGRLQSDISCPAV